MADQNFDISLMFTLKWEGGFSNDPHDPGGATMAGVTLSEFRIFTGNPNATVDDLVAITRVQLEDIYYINYWEVVRAADILPDGIDLSVYDMAVNAGPSRSVKIMQKVLGNGIAVDGVIGPQTEDAINSVVDDSLGFLRKLAWGQGNFYRSLATYKYFGRGWINRANARFFAARALLPNPFITGKAT
jgi:lysozyme family protein